MKPQPWTQIVVPQFHPDTWPDLPGYQEAAVRGFKDAPTPAVTKITKTRTRRTLADLTGERDALVAKRDRLGLATLPDDPGALSGIRRKPNGADHKNAARTDRELEQFTWLTRRIDYLDMRIRRDT